jgi:uncharacterized membrane protein
MKHHQNEECEGETMGHEVSIEIAAPPARVWAVMSDIDRWPEWTESVDTAQRGEPGPLVVGSTATIKQPKLARSKWVVTEADPASGFVWQSKSMGVTTTGGHLIEATADGGTRARLTLDMTGLLAPVVQLIGRSLIPRYIGFEAAGLKARSESPDPA